MTFRRLIGELWLGFFVLWWTWALFNKKAKRHASWRGRAWGMRLALIAAIVLTLQFERLSGLAGWLAAHGGLVARPTRFWQWAGLALCAAGFVFALWARLYLGANWGIPMSLRQGHELVTSGPYAHVRHPIYSGLMLAGLGTVLALGVAWLPAVVLAGLFFVFSARTEERMLCEQFPHTYPAYQARTRMLIPFVL